MSYNRTNELFKLSTSPYFSSFELEKSVHHIKNTKKVKILKCPDEKSSISFEDVINEFISENSNKYEILDIKYAEKSCLIIYKMI